MAQADIANKSNKRALIVATVLGLAAVACVVFAVSNSSQPTWTMSLDYVSEEKANNFAIAENVKEDERDEFVNAVHEAIREPLQNSAEETLESVITNARHRLAREFDQMLYEVKLAADNRLDKIEALNNHMNRIGNQVKSEGFQFEQVDSVDSAQMLDISDEHGSERTPSQVENAKTMQEARAEFADWIQHNQRRVSNAVATPTLKHAIAVVQVEVTSAYKPSIAGAIKDIDKIFHDARLAIKELGTTHFEHHASTYSAALQQLAIDPAMNTLNRQKKRFADDVEKDSDEYLRKETMKLIRQTVHITTQKMANAYTRILAKAKEDIDKHLNKLSGDARALYDDEKIGSAADAAAAVAGSGAAGAAAPGTATNASAVSASTQLAAAAAGSATHAAETSDVAHLTTGVAAGSKKIIQKAATQSVHHAMRSTRHHVSKRLENAVEDTKKDIDRHIMSLEHTSIAAQAGVAALAPSLFAVIAVVVAALCQL